jgi:hypothetical protein
LLLESDDTTIRGGSVDINNSRFFSHMHVVREFTLDVGGGVSQAVVRVKKKKLNPDFYVSRYLLAFSIRDTVKKLFHFYDFLFFSRVPPISPPTANGNIIKLCHFFSRYYYILFSSF